MKIRDLKLGITVDPFYGENCYVAHLEGRKECLIVDPSFSPKEVIAYINDHELVPVAILNTHGHADHISGNSHMKESWPDIPLIIGSGDASKLTDPEGNLSRPFGVDILSPPADQTVNEGDSLDLAGLELEVFETPGHSSGHVIFVWRGSPTLVFGGDVLFRGSIGRTDFPDGSFEQLEESIRKKLYCLPDDTIVLTGHGDPTEIGFEKATNPFVSE